MAPALDRPQTPLVAAVAWAVSDLRHGQVRVPKYVAAKMKL